MKNTSEREKDFLKSVNDGDTYRSQGAGVLRRMIFLRGFDLCWGKR